MKRDFRLLMIIIMFVFSLVIGAQRDFSVITYNEYRRVFDTQVAIHNEDRERRNEALEEFDKTYFEVDGVYFKAAYNWKEGVFLLALTALLASVTVKKDANEPDILRGESPISTQKEHEITKATP